MYYLDFFVVSIFYNCVIFVKNEILMLSVVIDIINLLFLFDINNFLLMYFFLF